ncbi:hypothetical protein K438DRAFT_914074 [Mycena galopus ATCC 62051]|nr:hypothetical protein K438DRAFT_914074 [Mycena galopus ATCC 62051]
MARLPALAMARLPALAMARLPALAMARLPALEWLWNGSSKALNMKTAAVVGGSYHENVVLRVGIREPGPCSGSTARCILFTFSNPQRRRHPRQLARSRQRHAWPHRRVYYHRADCQRGFGRGEVYKWAILNFLLLTTTKCYSPRNFLAMTRPLLWLPGVVMQCGWYCGLQRACIGMQKGVAADAAPTGGVTDSSAATTAPMCRRV